MERGFQTMVVVTFISTNNVSNKDVGGSDDVVDGSGKDVGVIALLG